MPIEDSGKEFFTIDANILVDAFDGALRELAVNRTHSEALVVAKYLILVAKTGERDPVRLRDRTVQAVRIERSTLPGGVLRSLITGIWATPFL